MKKLFFLCLPLHQTACINWYAGYASACRTSIHSPINLFQLCQVGLCCRSHAESCAKGLYVSESRGVDLKPSKNTKEHLTSIYCEYSASKQKVPAHKWAITTTIPNSLMLNYYFLGLFFIGHAIRAWFWGSCFVPDHH